MDQRDSLEEALTTLLQLHYEAFDSQNWPILAQIREVYSFVEAILIGKEEKVRLSLDKHEDRSDFSSRT